MNDTVAHVLDLSRMTERAEQELDCTSEQWADFIKKIEELGDKEVERILERRKKGQPEPTSLVGWQLHYLGITVRGEGEE